MILLRPSVRASVRASAGVCAKAGRALAGWPGRRWGVALAGAAGTALVVGTPTDVIPNPLFGRSVPVQWWNYPVLAITAALAGLVLATYIGRPAAADPRAGRRLGPLGSVLSFFAIGCPVCNKAVLLLLGTSGALTIWAPLQPVVALLSIALLAAAAARRLAGEIDCPASVPGSS
ncbi:hypothetical protein [Actinomadura sp. 7K507]|uniref:hypothetical protein n=1 Tax=Actinomadura sp. 7K507 TaxID=2530365 RepID=UPI00104FDB4E|nr:hypothetical protein [Actinomadura sp. 7K507]TDC85693.1 hypothetical protein E1285_24760 [Actinomadura sp. 7K507]